MIRGVGSLARSVKPARAATLVALGILCLWAYWPTLAAMGRKWHHDPQYSHGYLVLAFAVVLLWLRRSRMAADQWASCWWGILLLLGGCLLRIAGTYVYFDWLDGVSLLPSLAGMCVLLGGRQALVWAWPSIAFLLFMIPLPYRLETALAQPLQAVATRGSTYLLQTVGLPALAEGNTILLNRGRIGVVEACNGLSMMLVFFALATALAIVVRRPQLDKAVILLSAVPIAVFVNVLRITATGIAQEVVSPEAAQSFFHDWAGWLMMVVALGLLWAELRLLARILVPRASQVVPADLPPMPSGAAVNGKQPKRQPQGGPGPVLISRP
jgi:exosortase